MHLIMEKLAAIYSSGIGGKLVLLGVWWLFWPGLMFLVGIIGESRLVPIGRHQSRAFWPGDLSFGVAFVASIGLYTQSRAEDWIYDPMWWVIAMSICMMFFIFARQIDGEKYPRRAANSPTKIVHDAVGYFVIPTVLGVLGVPKIFGQSPSIGWPNKIVFLAAMAFYALCVRADAISGPVSIGTKNLRHPEDWQPLWRRKARH